MESMSSEEIAEKDDQLRWVSFSASWSRTLPVPVF